MKYLKKSIGWTLLLLIFGLLFLSGVEVHGIYETVKSWVIFVALFCIYWVGIVLIKADK